MLYKNRAEKINPAINFLPNPSWEFRLYQKFTLPVKRAFLMFLWISVM
jgi:hypothetical protein